MFERRITPIAFGFLGSCVAMIAAMAAVGCKSNTNAPAMFGGDRRVVLYEAGPGNWRVPLADATDADRQLGAYLRTKRPDIEAKLPSYYGQIFGETDGKGARLIHLNFFCENYVRDLTRIAHDDPKVDPEAWKRKEVSVDDGGACYFHVDFNTTDRTFENLQVNGEA